MYLLLDLGIFEYRGSSVSGQENGCSKKWKINCPSFSCVEIISFTILCRIAFACIFCLALDAPSTGVCWKRKGSSFRYASLSTFRLCYWSIWDAVGYIFSRPCMPSKFIYFELFLNSFFILINKISKLSIEWVRAHTPNYFDTGDAVLVISQCRFI